MHKISAILTKHKKLIIDSKPSRESIKMPIKIEQKTLKSHSSEFNIHKAYSNGKNDNTPKPHPIPQHRQSECLQNYLKLKLQKQINSPDPTKRLSLRHSLFEKAKESIPFQAPQDETISIGYMVDQVLTHLSEHPQQTPLAEDEVMVSRGRLKEVMIRTIESIISTLLHEQLPHCNCKQLNSLLIKLAQEIERQITDKTISRLKLQSYAQIYSWDGGQFYEKVENKRNNLQLECITFEQRIRIISSFQQSLKKQCKNAQQSLQQHKKQCQQVQNKRYKQQQHLKYISESIKQAESRLLHTLSQEESMRNYSSQQRTNQILRLISENYKKIESDMNEYAVYLQSNQIASDLQYESYSFKQLEEQIQTDQMQLFASLSHNKGLSSQKKVQMVEQFLEDAMGMLWRKDGEMRKIVEFKTNCIRQFVENMKRWFTHHQLKQQFLNNLRKQFATDATILRQLIERLQAKSNNREQIDEIKSMVQKLIENYKMGNSFY